MREQEWLKEVLELAFKSSHLCHPHSHHSNTPRNMTGHPSNCLLVVLQLFGKLFDMYKHAWYPNTYLGIIFGTATVETGEPGDPLDPPDAALCCDFWNSLSPPFNMALPFAHLSLAETFSFTSFDSFSSCCTRGGGNSESGVFLETVHYDLF
jgi:hypothetical protein